MTIKLQFSDSDAWTIANALRVAAQQYDDDAAAHREEPAGGGLMHPEARARLVQCFKDQAKAARAWADKFEAL